MARIEFLLEEQNGDLRSNEVALKFSIINNGQNLIEINSITPRIPRNVELIEVREPSYEITVVKYDKICSEITFLLNEYIESSNEILRKKKLNARRSRIISDRPSLFPILEVFVLITLIFKFVDPVPSDEDSQDNGLSAYSIRIENSKQAKDTLNRFLIHQMILTCILRT